jgi:hypothetical protein
MKTSLFPLAGLIPAFFVAPLTLHAELPGIPAISTPGTATWTTQVTESGTRLIFSFTGSSILDWSSGFNLSEGSEIVFNFVNSTDTVVNMLGGSGMNTIGGNVTSNGNIAFFSPNADLQISGNITGNSVTVATLDVDTTSFLSGGSYTLSGNPGGFNGLEVTGNIRATGGDVMLAGRRIDLSRDANINASGAIRLGAGTEIDVNPSAVGRKLKVKGEEGFVLNLGQTRASRIEIAAGNEITNKGRLDTGNGRIFLEVGNNGKVMKDRGIMVGTVSINGKVAPGASLKPNEGDSASALNPSTLKIPAVKRPDGSAVLASRTVASSTPVSASADGGRDRKGGVSQVASRDKKQPMLQRASFFGMRGGSTTVKK